MKKKSALAVVIAAAIVLVGCSSPDEQSAAEGATIEHAFGETTVPANPERVVTLGWGSADAALALDVVPVGMETQTYGANDDGLLPWIAEKLDEMGADKPTMIPATDEAPAYEDILALEPDLILAPYSGITEEQYELLSDIAPTVAYPEEAWTTPWQDVISIVGEALGKSDEAVEVLADIDGVIADAAAANPELEGKTVAAVWDVAGTFYVYRAADPRVSFLFGLGLENAPAVDELANGESTFYYTLSYEQLDQLESDILVNFADTQADADAFLAQPYAQAIPAVAAGAVANITGVDLIAAVSPPTALSLTWGLDSYVTTLSQAAAAVK
ncbi:iron-siderophore ABC transporter substrate-binding protein [Salinibacterium hongtaonis]|uniref:Iron-siderophore ABC transporter substrate-binding protein n=1 Tax=Homoserinimonas hongtaonis TaxID=2079791 RepID=A0A2U1SZR6_9MICO|nr:iron-siderophore ABC transporter substrate-binding protein [Salinibacterium hongtaonis]AWB89643.1 iron ABC transporter substrate-binding protein [Salinibacterium hongtaonis]PWB97096.1 iron-siderophore ABC transporter substrate-binding protein [Salinibacterium hongtaonis]